MQLVTAKDLALALLVTGGVWLLRPVLVDMLAHDPALFANFTIGAACSACGYVLQHILMPRPR